MTNNINGIDVSECMFYSNNNCDIGYIADSYPINCKNNSNCRFKQLKRLQEENKRLQMLSCANCGEKYLSPDGAELYEKNVRLQEENEGLKSLNDFNVQKIEVLQEENEKLYKALEEMRKEANRLLYEENPIYGYNNSNYFEILAKYVLAKTKEVLEDNEDVENNKL